MMDADTVRLLLDLLGPLRASIEETDAARARDLAAYLEREGPITVTMTRQQERNLTQAVLILQDLLRKEDR